MAKAASLTFLLFLVCATNAVAQGNPAAAPTKTPSQKDETASSSSQSVHANGNPAAGLDEACKNTPDPPFCGLFLQPYAAIFASKNQKKMSFAAVNATLGQVKSTKSFITREAFNDKTSKAHSALMTCVARIARSEGSLKLAAREFSSSSDGDAQRKKHKADPKKMLDSASGELNACLGVLDKAGGGNSRTDVAVAAMRKVKDSIIACSVAKSLIKC